MSYFKRIGESTFQATEHVSGAWNIQDQHIAPALGLLAHVVELDRDRRRSDGLVISRMASAVGLLDIANGMTARVNPKDVEFPNVDLTAHFFSQPHGDWIGFDTTVSFGPAGHGLTSSVVHDLHGPVGTVSQMLTVRPS